MMDLATEATREGPADFGKSIAAACEYAARAVAVAWGEPRASRRRLAGFLRDSLGEVVPAEESGLIEYIWNRVAEDTRKWPPSADLVAALNVIVEHLIQLAKQGPPEGWAPPEYRSLEWHALSGTEQTFMLLILGIVRRYGGNSTQVYLHGTRAKGNATEQSDYDIFVVFPDDIDRYDRAEAMSEILHSAERRDVKVSLDWDYAASWDDPTTLNDPTLIEQVKRYGIEVPGPET